MTNGRSSGLGTLLLLGGVGYVGFKLLGGSKPEEKKTTFIPKNDCDTPKDCDMLIACAKPILAKAGAADVDKLTKMLAQANSFGCASLAKEIGDLLSKFGAKPTDSTGGGSYSVMQGIGTKLQSEANPGDMLIIAVTDSTGTKKFVMPVIYDKTGTANDGYATYEKALAAIALDKFNKTSPIGDPTALLGAGSITLGAPSDMPDGTSFHVQFASLAGPWMLGSVIGVVTAAQMKGSTLTPAPTSSTAFDVAGEGGRFGRESIGGTGRFGTTSLSGWGRTALSGWGHGTQISG